MVQRRGTDGRSSDLESSSHVQPGTRTGRISALLAAITAAAALLRCTTVGQLLPHRLEPDPHQGTHLLACELGLEPAQYDVRTGFYPELLPRLAAQLPSAVTLPEPSAQASVEEHLAAAARPFAVM